MIGIHGENFASPEVFQGLLHLQHREQDAAELLSFDSATTQFHLHKDKGLVGQVFDKKNISYLEGESALGHTRYATFYCEKCGQPKRPPTDARELFTEIGERARIIDHATDGRGEDRLTC